MKSELVKIAKDEFNKNTAIVHFLDDDEQNVGHQKHDIPITQD